MPIFIKENQALKNNEYELPKHLEDHLKSTLAKYGNYSAAKGYKRLNSLVNKDYNKRSDDSYNGRKKVSFSDLKRIDHDFRHMSKDPKDFERQMNGGDEMANFARETLRRERTKVLPVLKQKKVETRNKNSVKPVEKPTQPVKPDSVAESRKIYISESQLITLKNLD